MRPLVIQIMIHSSLLVKIRSDKDSVFDQDEKSIL